MEEQVEKERGSATTDKKSGKDTSNRSVSSAKPWWLVVFLVLVLLFFGTYIGWLNSPQAELYPTFSAYLFGPRTSETIPSTEPSVSTDFVPATGDNSVPDSLQQNFQSDSWTTDAESTAPPVSVPVAESDTPSTATDPSAPPDTEKITYYIKAGEFKTQSAAQYRMKELQQGNYKPRLLPPRQPGEGYQVAVGEYVSYAKAREEARAIDFILEIRTSVEKRKTE